MTLLPRTATGRIALAIALSLLVHALLLFAPMVQLPPTEIPLPPLAAKLEPLPKIAAQPAPVKKPKPVVTKRPVVTDKAADDQTEQPEAPAAPPALAEEEAQPAQPLPRHAQLTFIAYKGTDFEIGEVRHRLEIGDDKNYSLRVGMNTTGIASLFTTFELNQQSSGNLTNQGLRPNEYGETRTSARGKEALDAKFDWVTKMVSFSNGNKAPLPEQAQDIISFLYQLSQLPLGTGTIPMYISNGKKLERYELAVGEEEEIQTRLGRLRALPLRKIHGPGEEGLDIWLGIEYRLLPVKIRQIDRAGEIAGEMVVSDIRVADE